SAPRGVASRPLPEATMTAMDRRLGSLLAGFALAGLLRAQEQKTGPKPPSAGQALAAARQKAQQHNKRALLAFLAKDDERSTALEQALKAKDLAHLLLYEFVPARIWFEQEQVWSLQDAALAAKYGVDRDKDSMPALV